jgi:hypothetical protein
MITNKIRALVDAYRHAPDHRWWQQSCDIECAIERIIAERDTLAAGVEECHCRLPAHQDEAVMKAALEVARRVKAASEPAKVDGDHGGKPSRLAVRMATMQEEVGGILKDGGMSDTEDLISALHAVARVVEELAKEDR